MLEERRRHERDVAKRRAGREQNDAGVLGVLVQPGHLLAVMREVRLVEQAEFLEVVLRVQVVFVNRLLPDDGVEEITALGHVAGRRAR